MITYLQDRVQRAMKVVEVSSGDASIFIDETRLRDVDLATGNISRHQTLITLKL